MGHKFAEKSQNIHRLLVISFDFNIFEAKKKLFDFQNSVASGPTSPMHSR